MIDQPSNEDLERRIAAGDADAMVTLGDRYYFGRGVAVDYTKARELFERAANQGSADGMFGMGFFL
jgi:TPR repeat protein